MKLDSKRYKEVAPATIVWMYVESGRNEVLPGPGHREEEMGFVGQEEEQVVGRHWIPHTLD